MKRVAALCGLLAVPKVAAIDSLMSVGCDGSMSMLGNTQLAMGIGPNPIVDAFLVNLNKALANTVRKICPFTDAQFKALFEISLDGLLRALDGSAANTLDTDAALWPASCPDVENKLADFNWKKVRDSVKVAMPSTCTSANWNTNGNCQLKIEILPQLNIEIKAAKCTGQAYSASVDIACNGARCTNLGRPCMTSADCGADVTCDDMGADLTENFESWGLTTAVEAYSSACAANGVTWGARMISSLARKMGGMLGLGETPGFSSATLKMCGLQAISDRYAATARPTPAPTSYAGGYIYDVFPSSGPSIDVHCSEANTTFGTVFTCRDLLASTFVHAPPPALTFVKVSGSASSKPLLWVDCDGNVQFLHNDAVSVVHAKLPFPKIVSAIEATLGDLLPCRDGWAAASAATTSLIKKYFSPWSMSFWSNVLMRTATDDNVLGNANPAAKLDSNLNIAESAYYRKPCINNGVVNNCGGPDGSWVSGAYFNYSTYENVWYNYPKPYPNVQGMPETCNSATMAEGNCAIMMVMDDLFSGMGSMSTGNINVKTGVCPGTGLPSFLAQCTGGVCDFVSAPVVKGTLLDGSCNADTQCPTGYECIQMTDGLSELAFAKDWGYRQYPAVTVWPEGDSALLNTLRYVRGETTFFASTKKACVVNVTRMGDNMDTWGNNMAVDAAAGPTMLGLFAWTPAAGSLPTTDQASGATEVALVGFVSALAFMAL